VIVPGPVAPAASAARASASAPAPAPAAASSAATVASVPPVTPTPSAAGEDELSWGWPTSAAAPIVSGFDEQRNKGVDLAGKLGDPVLASADGRVVYAGAGLRGYGNLIILKHNNTYLSAYAHNQTLLVKEDQTVRKGQKIAEMGSSDADRVKLHFEIRRQGKPVDPVRYLPARTP
jgi:lipoprotein NlpD